MKGRASATALLMSVGLSCGPNIGVDSAGADGNSSTSRGPTSAPPSGGSNPSEPIPSGSEPPNPATTIRYDINGIGFDVPFDPCDEWFDLEPVDRAVAFVLDNSRTMDDIFDGSGETTWFVLRTELENAIGAQTDPGDLTFVTYPNESSEAAPSIDACVGLASPGPPIPDAENYLDNIPAAGASGFLGSSPASDAVAAAFTQLGFAALEAPKTVAVFARRAPNCTEGADPPELFAEVDPTVAEQAAQMSALGLDTYVVALGLQEGQVIGGGADGDALADHLAELDAIASAGGTQAAIRADDLVGLQQAFAEIERRTRSCRLKIPFLAQGGFWYEVRVGDTQVLDTAACEFEPGYTWVDSGGDVDTLELCPEACDLLDGSSQPEVMPVCVIAE